VICGGFFLVLDWFVMDLFCCTGVGWNRKLCIAVHGVLFTYIVLFVVCVYQWLLVSFSVFFSCCLFFSCLLFLFALNNLAAQLKKAIFAHQ
jgi:hypothetical protein